MQKFMKGDTIIVLNGKAKGKITTIKKVVQDKLVLEGENISLRHTKNPSGDLGSIVSKEMPLHRAKVALYNPSTQKKGKIKFVGTGKQKERRFKTDNSVVKVSN
jgi:ribosomal protein L24